MFDCDKFFNRILLISGVGLLVFGILQPTGDSFFGVRTFLGLLNITVYLVNMKWRIPVVQKLLIMELYLYTPYLLYQNFIVDQDPFLMIFSTIIFFSGSFLFLSSRENLIYILFNGVNLFLYMVVSFFTRESIIIGFLFLCMYLFAYNIHRAFLYSIRSLKARENELKDKFFWMTNSIDSPLSRINVLIDVFEVNEQIETVKIEKQINEIKEQLVDLESEFDNR